MRVFIIVVCLFVSAVSYATEEQPGTYQLFIGRVKHTGPRPNSQSYTQEYLFKINTKTGKVWVASAGTANFKKDSKDFGRVFRKWEEFEYDIELEGVTLDPQ